ncbi:stage II sporulation protein M [Tichowtungia aerotolerans]|uniref:Stage II sporulation protein M n=1 Tax=Tichowtungia aerotolerans TaxID=2697043 RepID=A0A6P1M3I0_9BACT|nr:stage II sporulation protein M [Tichowtungia aerotolerans]QHI68407.1 stage II sporulation protein M [Tichowtungia aerotolerans]
MIINLQNFIEREKPVWDELDTLLTRISREPFGSFELEELKRFHYLSERTSADLVQIRDFANQNELQAYLESLVSRSFSEIQENRSNSLRFKPLTWFFKTFPQTFRRHARCFHLAVAITIGGMLFGGSAVVFDPSAKSALIPFPHLAQSPSQRVAEEEAKQTISMDGKGSFSAYLMTHNTRVSIFILALGIGWGIGSIALLFYNGVILGAVIADYVVAGQSVFLAGWLLPHGSIEIPAILIAGQGGLLLARAMIGWGNQLPIRQRLQSILPNLVSLIGGTACLLVWAGIVESFLSQDHEPALPYAVKIAVGLIELVLLAVFLKFSGRKKEVHHQL